MKKSVLLTTGLTLLVVVTLAALLAVSNRRSIRMTFLSYSQSPAGAFVRVHNGTPKNIVCLAQSNGSSNNSPLLNLTQGFEYALPGAIRVWTGTLWDIKSGKPGRVLATSAVYPVPAGTPVQLLDSYDLAPGQEVDLFVSLVPGASPKRVGTICLVARGKLANLIEPWLDRIRKFCGIKTSPTGQIEIWCSESLGLPATLDSAKP